MKKHVTAGIVLIACLFSNSVSFAQTGTVSLGGGFAGFFAGKKPALKTLNYREMRARAWLADLPQLVLSARYCEFSLHDRHLEAHYQTEFSLLGEYTFFNRGHSLSVNAGWLNIAAADAEKLTRNYLAVGGKGTYAATGDLQISGSAHWGLHAKKEPHATILKLELGAEYRFPQMPGFTTRAFFVCTQTANGEKKTQYGYSLLASYEVGF